MVSIVFSGLAVFHVLLKMSNSTFASQWAHAIPRRTLATRLTFQSRLWFWFLPLASNLQGVPPAVVDWEQQPVMGILINFSRAAKERCRKWPCEPRLLGSFGWVLQENLTNASKRFERRFQASSVSGWVGFTQRADLLMGRKWISTGPLVKRYLIVVIVVNVANLIITHPQMAALWQWMVLDGGFPH